VVREGYLELIVKKPAKDSTLQKILDLTFTAASRKSKSQLFIQKFASIYTPTVLVVSILLVVIPVFVLGQPFDPWLVQALTLLIISCPCALVISTPVSVFSAVGNASKRGVVVKGGRFLEELGKIRAIAFDKTRTITKGEPVVTDVIPFDHTTEEEVLGCLAGLETFSEHPVSKSVIEYAKQKGIALHPHSDFTASLGRGVKGTCTVCAEAHRCAGTLQYVTEEHGPVGKEIIEKAEVLTRQGKTVIYVSSGEHIEGIVAVSDSIKDESAETVRQLGKLGVVSYMLTGDSKEPAQFIADKVGISHVFSSLLPQDKTERIREMKEQYGSVGMVGDGVNDAPSLALSDVGIAMGAAGSDVAIENADIAIMNDNLSFLPGLITLSRRMNRIIRFNVSLAVLTKLAFLGFAVAGYSSIIGAIVADVGVSVFVILNSLRLFENEKMV
jgi:Cd2+/Zn2+-exporting ATPase